MLALLFRRKTGLPDLLVPLALGFQERHEIFDRANLGSSAAIHVVEGAGDDGRPVIGPDISERLKHGVGPPLLKLGGVDAAQELADCFPEGEGEPEDESPFRAASKFFIRNSMSAAVSRLRRAATS